MTKSTDDTDFTPALGNAWLTPLYDTAIAFLTREEVWRSRLVHSIAPDRGDRIVDVGCGTGSLAIRLKQEQRHCEVIAVDPDPDVLEIARRKAKRAGVTIDWRQGGVDQKTLAGSGEVTKVVSSLVFHQTPLAEKKRLLSEMEQILVPGGSLFIADYGRQRTRLMRMLFRMTVQLIDGVEDTQSNADGVMPDLLNAAGFIEVRETLVLPTATGSISFYQASKPGKPSE